MEEATTQAASSTSFRRLRLAGSVAIVAVVLLLLVLCAVEEHRTVRNMVGAGMRETEVGILVSRVEPGLPADAAGLAVGDIVVAVDGAPVPDFAAYDVPAATFYQASGVRFTVRRERELLDLTVAPGAPFRFARFLTARTGALLYLVLGLVALASAGADLRARLLTLFSFAVAVELALPDGAYGLSALDALPRAAYLVLSGLQVGLFLHLASVIPDTQPWVRRRPWVVPLFYVVGAGFGLVAALVYVAETFDIAAVEVTSRDLSRAFNAVLLPLWAVAMAAILAREALRHPEPEGRQKAGLVLVGVLPWTLYIVVSTYLPEALAWLSWYQDSVQSVILLCYPLAVFFAIFRYQLFDIEVVVRRGLVYTALTVILVVLGWILLALGGVVAGRVVSEGAAVWVVSLTTLLIGLLFSPLRNLVRATVDRRFFPERYALRQRLIALAEELPGLRQLPRMGDHLVERMREIFAVRSVTLLIGDPETGVLTTLATTRSGDDGAERSLLVALDDPGIEHLRGVGRPLPTTGLRASSAALAQRLAEADITLAVPVASRRALTGVVLLGAREGSQRYPAEELELLSLLSHLVATTFENARLFESATYEGLTGLLRREAIIEHLHAEVARAQRYGRPLTVGMADLDHFKQVNDRFGHLVGDAVLQRVARTIAAALRGTDSVGRYGGEEFLLVLPETTLEEGARVAEKVRELVQEVVTTADDGREVRVTISIGLASLDNFDAGEGVDAIDLIAVADSNLYAAKSAGRNRIEVGLLA